MPTNTMVLHPSVADSLFRLVRRPVHAVLVTGPAGSGKKAVSTILAADLLEIEPENIGSYPYIRIISSIDQKAISIETIRELQQFLALKIPGKSAVARIVIIYDAHLLTIEAQNALLKTLEEPPTDTVIILTSESTEELLPTIQSRVRVLQLVAPPMEKLREHFLKKNFELENVDKALMLSGGMPGLAHALLVEQEDHALYSATAQARLLLQASAYDRLLQVDALSKQKQHCQHIVFILGQMARMALLRSADHSSQSTDRWQRIIKAAYTAQLQLKSNAQTKLILTNLMLAL